MGIIPSMTNKTDKTNTPLLDSVIIEPAQTAKTSIIWLHGLGADGHDFEGIAPHIILPSTAAVRYVFPHAPIRPVTINNGYEMRAWYDIKSVDIADKSRADKANIDVSVEQVRDLIEEEISKGIPADKIILAGFSQGGVIALQTALQYEKPLGGVMVLSSYVALSDDLLSNLNDANKTIPIFLAHGLQDAVLPYTLFEQTKELLKEADYSFTEFSYPMEHNVSGEEIADITTWLTNLKAIK